MQQATIQVDFVSKQQADEFLDRLREAKHKFDVHVKLGWSAGRSYLKQFLQKLSGSAVELKVEGVTPE